MPAANMTRLRRAAGAARNRAHFALGQAGLVHSSSRLTHDASQYWDGECDDRWQNDSHWRSGSKFDDTELWGAMGKST